MSNLIKKYSYYLWSIFELLIGFKDPLLIIQIFLKSTPFAPRRVRLRKEGLDFVVRSAMDVWSVKEAFLDRFYERFGVPLADEWEIIDVGAGIGEYTLFAAHKCPAAQVFAFEPFHESFKLLKTNLALNQVNNVQAYEMAVWSKAGYLMLDSAPGEPSQFISSEVDAHPQDDENENFLVPSISLADVFSLLDLERCDLLKLDCEGAEYPILLNAPPEVLDKIDRIILEYHDNVTDDTHQSIVEFLSAQGYQVQITPNYVHTYLGYLYAQRAL